jgi:hypothetical protein
MFEAGSAECCARRGTNKERREGEKKRKRRELG